VVFNLGFEYENEIMNRLNLERTIVLALTKIRPRIEVLACQKETASSHQQVRITLIID
jgi:hypothetical protein